MTSKNQKTLQPKPINQELQQRVSLETGIPLDIVKSVTEFQGTYTAKVIKEGMFESVQWPYLGKIVAPVKKVQNMNDKVGRPHYKATKKPI
jgi:hypothetical protein